MPHQRIPSVTIECEIVNPIPKLYKYMMLIVVILRSYMYVIL